VEIGLNALLSLFAETRTKATFFVLGWVAERQPGLVRQICDAGHEIASHGHMHRVIQSQSAGEFRSDIRQSKAILEDLIGGRVRGYRAPSYSITRDTMWALTEIRQAGYTYDSSIYPVRAPHGRYGIPGAPKQRYEPIGRLHEYPLPVVKLLGMEFPALTGAYLRLWPMALHRLAMRQYQRRGTPLIINVHPWELDPDQPRRKISFRHRLQHYARLHQTRDRLRDLLNRGTFTSIQQLELLYGKQAKRDDVVWPGQKQVGGLETETATTAHVAK
jgi:polysaccharide deacetylase family protein (PEP-CTERM system associated)